MAQDDLKLYFEFKKKLEVSLPNLDKALRLISENDFLQEVPSLVDEIKKQKKVLLNRLEELKVYSLCEHDSYEEQYNGHDSHHDYYITVCKECGKTLSERTE